MRRSLVSVSTVALAFIAIFANPASAQRVLGVGDDALVLPRGVFRFRTLGQWTWFNERYGKDTPGRPDGALEPWGSISLSIPSVSDSSRISRPSRADSSRSPETRTGMRRSGTPW